MRMKTTRSRHMLAFLAPALALVALTGLAAGEAAAQVRPAYVKNVDEPGLVPFKMSFRVSQNDCNCTNCCFVQSETVPAGKRLVIRNVAGYVALQAFANLGPVTLSQLTPSNDLTLIATMRPTFRNQWNGGDYPAYEFNDDVLAYVDAGNKARFAIYTGGSWDFRGGLVSISGYYVGL